MTTYQQYLGSFAADALSFSAAGEALTTTAGTYYIAGYTAEATAQFAEHLQAVIRAAVGVDLSLSTVNYSAGHIGIALLDALSAPVVGDLVWTDAELGLLLGFTGSQTGQSEYEATYSPRYVWRPSVPVKNNASLSQWWTPRSNTRVTRGPLGHTFGAAGSLLYEADVEYLMIPEAECRIGDSATGYNQLERFFKDVAHAAQPIRCYRDRTLNTLANIETAMWAPTGDSGLGSWGELSARFDDRWEGRWSVRLRLWKHVTS